MGRVAVVGFPVRGAMGGFGRGSGRGPGGSGRGSASRKYDYDVEAEEVSDDDPGEPRLPRGD